MESLPYISKIPCSLLQGASNALDRKGASEYKMRCGFATFAPIIAFLTPRVRAIRRFALVELAGQIKEVEIIVF